MEHDDVFSGVCLTFSGAYGFIEVDANGRRIRAFVHQSAVEMPGYRTLKETQRVEARIAFDDPRGPRATWVRPLD